MIRKSQMNSSIKSGIKVYPGHGGSPMGSARMTAVEFPFTELTPTTLPEGGIASERCEKILDKLSLHQRDVVLAILCARYGNIQKGS
jgi:hypothetical protein